jgi:hypothetical protein
LGVALMKPIGNQASGLCGFCGRIVKTTWRQVIRHWYAEHRRAGHDEQRDGDDPPRRSNGQPSNIL